MAAFGLKGSLIDALFGGSVTESNVELADQFGTFVKEASNLSTGQFKTLGRDLRAIFEAKNLLGENGQFLGDAQEW
jgi:hypothetical protein